MAHDPDAPIAVDDFIAGRGFTLCESCAGEFDRADLSHGLCAGCEDELVRDR